MIRYLQSKSQNEETDVMNYIVLDLEWNQSNTGEEPEVKEIPF